MSEEIKTGGVSRRGFLEAVGVVGASAMLCGLAGCAPSAADSTKDSASASTDDADWLGTEPAMPDKFKEEIETDVVVVGLGWAGVCATRAACEAGASVTVFEKGSGYGLLSKNVHAYGSKLWLKHFPDSEKFWDRSAIINAVMQGCLNRNNDAIQGKWLDTNGEAFDWFFGAMEGSDMVFATSDNYLIPKDAKIGVTETSYPYPANFNPATEYYPCFPGTAKLSPDASPFFDANMAKAKKAADDKLAIYKTTPVIKLLKEDGRITGVVAKDADGNFYKATAKKGVVLATGDFFENKAMVNAFLSRRFPDGVTTLYSVVDADGKKCNVGDGHRMGVWAGAKMQLDGCDMSHAIGGGTYVMGTLPALFLNKDGKRYMNEDVQGQQVAERIWEQKDSTAYQIFDTAFFNHTADMPYGHGKHPEVVLKTIESEAANGNLLVSDTIEELIGKLDIDKDTALASIKHYNELCEKGIDQDYGKAAKRMIPVSTGPFYCDTYKGDGSTKGLGHLVTMSGLESDKECHVYDEGFNVIPGLYVAGNVQGNRFAVIYPEILQGQSIAMAMTFGYIAGQNAAAGK
jgi:fumarate reductase flavoprotein subunit